MEVNRAPVLLCWMASLPNHAAEKRERRGIYVAALRAAGASGGAQLAVHVIL